MAAGLLLRVRRRAAQALGHQGPGGVALLESEIFAPGALAGQVALITGGGTNLGKAAAAELLSCGASVVIAGRREEVLEAAVAELGPNCSWVSGDIRQADGAQALVRAVMERHGALDVLVNNAGGQYFAPAEGITAKGWKAVQQLNIGGTLAMSEAAHELAMGPTGQGTVINITVSPHRGFPAMAHSGTARAAVEAMTLEHARRWSPDGVSVIAIALGRLATESLRKYPVELWRKAAESVPLQRLGEMTEYGWLVALLASPLGRALSGSVVTLDGALDNWQGRWPPEELTRDGEVPTEERSGHS